MDVSDSADWCASLSGLPAFDRAMPKSPSFTRRLAVSRKFAGLMSRWMTIDGCRLWRYSMANAMSMQIRRLVFCPGFSRGTKRSTLPSGKSSMTSVRAGVRA